MAWRRIGRVITRANVIKLKLLISIEFYYKIFYLNSRNTEFELNFPKDR